ncbi:hypothetical protein TPS_00860 [Trichinella pseudospiralis]
MKWCKCMSYRNRLLVLPDSGEDYSGRRRRHQRHFWTTASFITATPDFSVVHIHENGDLRDSAEVLSTGSVRNTTEPRRGSIRQAERGIRTNPLIGWCAIFSRPLVEVDHNCVATMRDGSVIHMLVQEAQRTGNVGRSTRDSRYMTNWMTEQISRLISLES